MREEASAVAERTRRGGERSSRRETPTTSTKTDATTRNGDHGLPGRCLVSSPASTCGASSRILECVEASEAAEDMSRHGQSCDDVCANMCPREPWSANYEAYECRDPLLAEARLPGGE